MNAKRVLIIDDDPDFAGAVTALLEGAGYQVGRAPNGTIGLAQAKKERPDIILLDVMMDERTEGFFTLQEIRRTADLARTPVIIVSSFYTEVPHFRVDPQAGWLPADQFMPKPVDPAQLLAEVGRLVDRAASAAQRAR